MDSNQDNDDARGLIVYRASRLEALLEPLQKLMQAAPPRHVLAPHEIIVAHPGMLKWLSRALALQRGPHGIAANLRIELPSEWLDRLALQVLGEEAVALRPYRRDVLRWLVHDCLDAIDDPALAAYLGGDSRGRALRRFQLADRLARIYTRYLVYRPDWLRDWAAGRPGAAASHFLAPLWREVRTRIGKPHRGEMLARLVAALAAADPHALDAEPLHVFGVAHLAPSELGVLHAVARHRLVVLYVPDPCREYWGGLRSERQRLRDLLRLDPDGEQTQTAFLEQDHPLLAAWGRQGQQFLLALEDSQAREDRRHWQDSDDAAPAGNRLQRLQESIRQLRPELIGVSPSFAEARADASLRVHACHTRLRELEALRDALLRLRTCDSSLKASDIIVMMPDVHAYLPLLPTVFGEPGRHEGPLPYHCFDVAVSRSHSLFAALRQLLDLPQSRIAAPEVVDLLGVPEVARRLALDADEIDTLAGWLRNSRVAWALDATFRARFDVPAIAEHTFAWAMDRMLAGYLFGGTDDDEPRAVDLPDGSRTVPVDGISGPQAALVGALDALLVELQAWCTLAAAPRRASEWSAALESRFESLFRIDPTDRRAREAKVLILRFVRALASEPAESGLDPLLEFSAVREVLLRRLDAVPERQRFLLGGVTFCGMVPQRSIPFRVVAVLGLNDGEFPRTGGDAELDLMSTLRRSGDRDARGDDRYLFLETVMSARDALHLSYIGEGVRDGQARNPAAPLAELMAALDAESVADPAGPDDDPADKEKRERPWFVRHPLQPFDARYFGVDDPTLFSFRGDFAAMRRDADANPSPVVFVGDEDGGDAGTSGVATVALGEVLAYYRDPAKQLLAKGLNLRLDALADDGLGDSEPLEARFEALDRVAKRLFLEAAGSGRALPDGAPDWLRLTGLLPPGRLGDVAWHKELDEAQHLVATVAGHELFDGALPNADTVSVDRVLPARDARPGFRLRGEVRHAYRRGPTLWRMELYPGRDGEDALDFKSRIGFFLEWALLRLADPAPARRVRACVVVARGRKDDHSWERGFNGWDDAFTGTASASGREAMLADLEHRVHGLLDFWQRSQRHPQWYFPATSWAAATQDADAAGAQWLGDFGRRAERDYAPGFARLLAGDREFDGAGFEVLRENAVLLFNLIDLDGGAERSQ